MSKYLIIDPECYKEFGPDLDACSRQENQGCRGCKCAKEVEEDNQELIKAGDA